MTQRRVGGWEFMGSRFQGRKDARFEWVRFPPRPQIREKRIKNGSESAEFCCSENSELRTKQKHAYVDGATLEKTGKLWDEIRGSDMAPYLVPLGKILAIYAKT